MKLYNTIKLIEYICKNYSMPFWFVQITMHFSGTRLEENLKRKMHFDIKRGETLSFSSYD